MFLFKAILDPAAQLARGIVLTAGNRAELQSKRRARPAQTIRFRGRAGRPPGPATTRHRSEVSADTRSSAASAASEDPSEESEISTNTWPQSRLRLATWEISPLGMVTTAPWVSRITVRRKRQMFHASHDGADPHGFAHDELIFNDHEKSVDEVANQMLRAETERKACESCDRGDGRDIESELRQRRENRSDENHGRSGAVQDSRERLHVLFSHPGDSADGSAVLPGSAGA